MKYKKLKRALAMSLAVLMAVPTVSYGGMAEVHAEEALEESGEVTEEQGEAADTIVKPEEEKTVEVLENVADPKADEETSEDPETKNEDSKDEVKEPEIEQTESEEKSDEKADDKTGDNDVIQDEPEAESDVENADAETSVETEENAISLFSADENLMNLEADIQLQFVGRCIYSR